MEALIYTNCLNNRTTRDCCWIWSLRYPLKKTSAMRIASPKWRFSINKNWAPGLALNFQRSREQLCSQKSKKFSLCLAAYSTRRGLESCITHVVLRWFATGTKNRAFDNTQPPATSLQIQVLRPRRWELRSLQGTAPLSQWILLRSPLSISRALNPGITPDMFTKAVVFKNLDECCKFCFVTVNLDLKKYHEIPLLATTVLLLLCLHRGLRRLTSSLSKGWWRMNTLLTGLAVYEPGSCLDIVQHLLFYIGTKSALLYFFHFLEVIAGWVLVVVPITQECNPSLANCGESRHRVNDEDQISFFTDAFSIAQRATSVTTSLVSWMFHRLNIVWIRDSASFCFLPCSISASRCCWKAPESSGKCMRFSWIGSPARANLSNSPICAK